MGKSLMSGVLFDSTLTLQGANSGHIFVLTQGLSLSALFGSILTPFLCFHTYLTSQNMTTIEYCEKLGSRSDDVTPFFNLGVFRNFQQVFGDGFILFSLLSFGNGPLGDGLSFPVNEKFARMRDDNEEHNDMDSVIVDRLRKRSNMVNSSALTARGTIEPGGAGVFVGFSWVQRITNFCEEVNKVVEKCAVGARNILSKDNTRSVSEGIIKDNYSDRFEVQYSYDNPV